MSHAVYILATNDPALAAAWATQIPAGRIALRLTELPATPLVSPLVILDVLADSLLPQALRNCVTLAVGQPNTVPFEAARQQSRARAYLSYDDSRNSLAALFPLLEELALKEGLVQLLSRSPAPSPPPVTAPVLPDQAAAVTEFMIAALGMLTDRAVLLAECQSAVRRLLGACHATILWRAEGQFRGPNFALAAQDPLVSYLYDHPMPITLPWAGPSCGVAELAARNHLSVLSAKALLPMFLGEELLGLLVLGRRRDGHPYDQGLLSLGHLLAQACASALVQADTLARQATALRKSEVSARATLDDTRQALGRAAAQRRAVESALASSLVTLAGYAGRLEAHGERPTHFPADTAHPKPETLNLAALVESTTDGFLPLEAKAITPRTGLEFYGEPRLLACMLRGLASLVLHGHGSGAQGKVTVELRSAGTNGSRTVLLSVRGLPSSVLAAIEQELSQVTLLDTHLLREGVRLHQGSIQCGPGMDGPEVQVALVGLTGDFANTTPTQSVADKSEMAILPSHSSSLAA